MIFYAIYVEVCRNRLMLKTVKFNFLIWSLQLTLMKTQVQKISCYCFKWMVEFVAYSSCIFVLKVHDMVLITVKTLQCKSANCTTQSVSSSSWGLGRAAVCDYGTPWTFFLPFFFLPAWFWRKILIRTLGDQRQEIILLYVRSIFHNIYVVWVDTSNEFKHAARFLNSSINCIWSI